MLKTAHTLQLKDCHLYKMAGNAVTVNVVETIAKKLWEAINE
jgi:site-specific DNA-cytosine methylase